MQQLCIFCGKDFNKCACGWRAFVPKLVKTSSEQSVIDVSSTDGLPFRLERRPFLFWLKMKLLHLI